MTTASGHEMRQQASQFLCLELLLDFIGHMADRNSKVSNFMTLTHV